MPVLERSPRKYGCVKPSGVEGSVEDGWVQLHRRVETLHTLSHYHCEDDVDENRAIYRDQVEQFEGLSDLDLFAFLFDFDFLDERVSPDVECEHVWDEAD